MNDDELRARIQEFMRRGDLPHELPLGIVTRLLSDNPVETSLEVGPRIGFRCFICTEPEPDITHRYSDGKIIAVHGAPCEALWREEQTRLARRAARALHQEE
jgi:hypothetical protein